jgi:hypothetical protein
MVQIPDRRGGFGSFEIEVWNLFGIYNLVFGILTLFGSGYVGSGDWVRLGESTWLTGKERYAA